MQTEAKKRRKRCTESYPAPTGISLFCDDRHTKKQSSLPGCGSTAPVRKKHSYNFCRHATYCFITFSYFFSDIMFKNSRKKECKTVWISATSGPLQQPLPSVNPASKVDGRFVCFYRNDGAGQKCEKSWIQYDPVPSRRQWSPKRHHFGPGTIRKITCRRIAGRLRKVMQKQFKVNYQSRRGYTRISPRKKHGPEWSRPGPVANIITVAQKATCPRIKDLDA
jgi:hypothetical protein